MMGSTGAQFHFRCDGRLDAMKPGEQVILRLTYSNEGTKSAGAFIEVKPQNNKYAVTELTPTDRQWARVEIPFTRPDGGSSFDLVVRATKDDGQTVASDTVWVKSVEVVDP